MFISRFEKYFPLSHTLLLSALLIIALYIHTHGFPTADEGWILEASKRLAEGDVIYKNFQFIYHPGVLYINAFAFDILGVSVLTSRLVACINTLLSLILLLYICKKNRLTFVLTMTTLTGFLLWGAGHINFSWPVMFCLTLALASAALWTAWFSNKNNDYLVAIGAITAVTVLFKQNFGLAMIAINCLSLLFFIKKNRADRTLRFLSGAVAILLFQLLYFWSTDSLSWYLVDMRYLLIERIFLRGVLNSQLPWDYPAPMLYKLIKIIVYNVPLLVGVTSLILAWRKKNDSVMYFSVLSLSYFGLSIRPTTDYIHLTPLLALSFFPAAYLCSSIKNKSLYFLLVIFMFGLVLAGGYSAIFKNYYRWDIPLIQQNQFSTDPHLLVSVDKQSAETIRWAEQFFINHPDDPYFFVYSFSPQLMMMSDKTNPTRYDYLHTGVLSQKVEQEVITNLQEKHVQFLLTDVDVYKEHDTIAQFIRSSYSPLSSSGKYIIWQKHGR